MITWLYLHKDEHGKVLYAGASNDPLARTIAHSQTSQWFSMVRSIDVLPFETKELALQAEAQAIISHIPPYNKICIVNGKAVKISWNEQVRARYLALREKVKAEVDRIGYLTFMELAKLNAITMQRICFDDIFTPQNNTMKKLEAYFAQVGA